MESALMYADSLGPTGMEAWEQRAEQFQPYGTDVPEELQEDWDAHVLEMLQIVRSEEYLSTTFPFHLLRNFDFSVKFAVLEFVKVDLLLQ